MMLPTDPTQADVDRAWKDYRRAYAVFLVTRRAFDANRRRDAGPAPGPDDQLIPFGPDPDAAA